MARIKINDLPKDQKISKDEMKRVYGGGEGSFDPWAFMFKMMGMAKDMADKTVDIVKGAAE